MYAGVLDLEMPSKQYHLEVKDVAIATLNVDMSVVTALEFGDTDVVLKDRCILFHSLAYYVQRFECFRAFIGYLSCASTRS